MEIVAGSMNTDTRKKIQRSPSVVNSLKMLFRSVLKKQTKTLFFYRGGGGGYKNVCVYVLLSMHISLSLSLCVCVCVCV